MTTFQRCRIASGAWTEWPDPMRAVLRVSCFVAGDTEEVVEDLCALLSTLLPWGDGGEPDPAGVYGVTIFPESTLPLDTPDGGEARLEAGALVVLTDQNQPAPEYEDGSPDPANTEVRLRFEQPISSDLADRGVFLQRRKDIKRALRHVYGTFDAAQLLHVEPPRPITNRSFSSAYSEAYG